MFAGIDIQDIVDAVTYLNMNMGFGNRFATQYEIAKMLFLEGLSR